MIKVIENLWMFVRRDLPVEEFERWVYESTELEDLWGVDMCIDAISLNYKDQQAVDDFRISLRFWLKEHTSSKGDCDCVTWRNNEVNPSDYALLDKFETLRRQTPWLDLMRCPACGSHWYVGVDTVDDDYYVSRIKKEWVDKILNSNEWPTQFDKLKNLWPDDEWLKLYGFKDLTEWQEKNNYVKQ